MMGQYLRRAANLLSSDRNARRLRPRSRAGLLALGGEQLEVRTLLAVAPLDPIDASQIEIITQADGNQPGAWNVTFRRIDGTDAPMRLELRLTDEGLAFRTDTVSLFDADLDRISDGIQTFSVISTITIIGGAGDDVVLLDETQNQLAGAFVIEGDGGFDRVEHRRQEGTAHTSHLVEVNAETGTVQLTRDGTNLKRETRTIANTSVEDLAFYGANAGVHADLIVRTGSGQADSVRWMPGRFDVELGSLLGGTSHTRVWYEQPQSTWLFTAGGGDTVTIDDRATGGTTAKQSFFVSTEDEDDLIRINLGGTRSSVDIAVEGRGGFNRLELYSLRNQAEEIAITGQSINYLPAGAAVPNFIGYSEIRQLYLATGGGNDLIAVDQSGTSHFPDAVTLYGQEGDDEFELNVTKGSTTWSIDGGAGKNSLTSYFDAASPPEDTVHAIALLSHNRLNVHYSDTNPAAAASTFSPAATDIYYDRLQNLTIDIADDTDFVVQSDAHETLLDEVLLVNSQGEATAHFAGLAVARSTKFTIETQRLVDLSITTITDPERVDLTDKEVVVRLAEDAAGISSVDFPIPERFSVGTHGGDDTVTIKHTNTLTDFRFDSGDGNDVVDVSFTQAPNFGTAFHIEGGAGSDDRLFLRDFAGNQLNLTVWQSPATPGRLTMSGVDLLLLYGLDGNDRLVNESNVPSMMDGGSGNDTLIGGSQADQLYGSVGVDQLFGRAGDDTLMPDYDSRIRLFATAGELVDGGPGNDILQFGSGDQLIPSGGDDRLLEFAHP